MSSTISESAEGAGEGSRLIGVGGTGVGSPTVAGGGVVDDDGTLSVNMVSGVGDKSTSGSGSVLGIMRSFS